jgi:hypothetical protein
MSSRDEDEERRFRRRQELISRVYESEITVADAEAEATRLGLGELASKPPAHSLDPAKRDRWTLGMTVAWIAWRSKDKVCESWSEYTDAYWYWFYREFRVGPDGPIECRHVLEQLEPAGLNQLMVIEAIGPHYPSEPQPHMTVRAAREDLWRKLRRGALYASATDGQGTPRQTIPVEHWDDLVPDVDGEKDILRCRLSWPLRAVRYYDVLFDSAIVMSLWPRLPERLDRPPALVPLDGKGLIPFSCAAHWVATRGGTVDVGSDRDRWRAAYSDLLEHIAADELDLYGTRGGTREQIDGIHVADCPVVLPFENQAAAALDLGSDLVLFSALFVDEQAWRDGVNDSLRDADGPRWSRLMVRKEQVADLWPLDSAGDGAAMITYSTGAAGRRSSMHLVEPEMRARAARGELIETFAGESEFLAVWLKRTHPKAAKATAKTIRNNLGAVYRSLKPRPK